MASQQQESKTIPLKVLVDKQINKVVLVETTKDFVETIFSFLTLPLATIVRLLATCKDQNQHQQSESSQFLGNIKNLYQSVQNITSNDFWTNPTCKQMLLCPRNPCESLCQKLFLNIDDTETTKFFLCEHCYRLNTFENLSCTCRRPRKMPMNLDSEGQGNNAQNGVFLKGSGAMFLVSDNLKILPSSKVNSLMMLVESGCSDLTQLEELIHNIGKQEILNILRYTLTSHEPLTNTILRSISKIKYNPPNRSTSAVRVTPSISDGSKMDIKVVQSKSQKKIITIEDNGDFVDFIFSFLTMPLSSMVNLLGANAFAGCVGNLYKSVENLVPNSVLLNPGIAPLFGCPNQPLNIPHVELPTYYYDTDYRIFTSKTDFVELGYSLKKLIVSDPKGGVGFVKRKKLYGVGDDLKVNPLSANFSLSYFKELNLPIDDLEVKVITIGEAEALRFLGALLTSKFTFASGLQDFLNVTEQESTILKVPKQESTILKVPKQES